MKLSTILATMLLALAGNVSALELVLPSPHVHVTANLPSDEVEGKAQTFNEFDNTVINSHFNFITEKNGVTLKHYVQVQTVTDKSKCQTLPFCNSNLDIEKNFNTLKASSGLEKAKVVPFERLRGNAQITSFFTEGPVSYTKANNKLYRFMTGAYVQITPTTQLSIVTELDALKKTIDTNHDFYKHAIEDAAINATKNIKIKVLK